MEQNKDQGSAAVRGEAVENQLAAAVLAWWDEHKYDVQGEDGTYNVYDEEPNHVVLAKKFIAAISARAADAPSEPMSKDLEWLIQCADEARTNPELATTLRNNVKNGVKSRAADALDSQPTESEQVTKLKEQNRTDFMRWERTANSYRYRAEAAEAEFEKYRAAYPASSQTTDGAPESHDSIFGKVICILSDEASEWSNEDQPIFDRCIERILDLKRQPTDGGVRNG